MKYRLKEPCKHCPFRNDSGSAFFANGQRVEDILDGMDYRVFPCHKTADFDENGDQHIRENTQACAGALIMMKKANVFSAAVQILERLGIIASLDHLKLDAPVYDSPKDCVQQHDRYSSRLHGSNYAARRKDVKRDYTKWWWR